MSQFKSLTDAQLIEKIKSLAGEERELTKNIVEHIAEVDRRRLFLAMAYPSLFEWLTKEIGYSEGAAQRRIDAARLFQRVPQVAAKIESGAINLAQISKLQKAVRLARKDDRAVAVGEQRAILEKLENKGAQQTDLILAEEFQLPVKVEEKKRIQRDESVRVELTFSKGEMELINRAREILSYKTGGGLKSTMLEMAQKIVAAARPKAAQGLQTPAAKVKSTATVAVKPVPKTLTSRIKKEILARDHCCQYRDKTTGKICGAKHFLEIDHIQPRFAQGTNAPENLRVLCKNHNMYRYQAEL